MYNALKFRGSNRHPRSFGRVVRLASVTDFYLIYLTQPDNFSDHRSEPQ